MLVYILRRLPQTILVILGVTLITFIALQIGGDPTYLFVSERASPEEIIATRIKLGFDKPLYVQYLTYLKNLLLLDFGDSLYFRQPAMKVIFETLPATIELTIFSMLIAVFGSIPFGVYAAINRGKWLDGTLMAIAMLGQSVPNFWLGIMCILYISLNISWLPISGHVPFLMPIFQGDFMQGIKNFPTTVTYLLLPSFTVAFYSLSRNARLVRSSMLEVLSQDYVRTARAKGLTEYTVIMRHAMRNAWLPVVTIIGLEFGFMISGVVVVEVVFAWPGLGRTVFDAIAHRDIPLVQASVVVIALFVIIINLITDLIYAKLDPRIKL
ncbi:MAG: ABC transporter permease [Pelagibacteraceae bacterium]|jgi:peptide/nickel transport system permease protein|nr:ABC transporter permease [Pelagibacteraceae bacterium]